ncbi:MAG: type II secretion system GspH family protein [Azovibrio sp.]|nr:type II secretion system GspH family protein [Azovibrio sp.]
MWSKCRGITLVELILAIVVIGAGLAGVLVAFQTAVRASADPLVRKQMAAIAEEMVEEISLRPFAATPNAAPAPCARDTFNDIDDYNGYNVVGICDIAGNALPQLADYQVAVAVTNANLAGLTAKRIEVDVRMGGQRLALVAYRTNWAN